MWGGASCWACKRREARHGTGSWLCADWVGRCCFIQSTTQPRTLHIYLHVSLLCLLFIHAEVACPSAQCIACLLCLLPVLPQRTALPPHITSNSDGLPSPLSLTFYPRLKSKPHITISCSPALPTLPPCIPPRQAYLTIGRGS